MYAVPFTMCDLYTAYLYVVFTNFIKISNMKRKNKKTNTESLITI